MKFFAVLAIILAVTSFAKCDDEDSGSSEEMLAELIRAMIDIDDSEVPIPANGTIIGKTFEKKCPGQGEAIEKALREVNKCDDEHANDPTVTMCHYIKNNLATCLEPVQKELEKCAPEAQKFGPKFVIDTGISILTWVCDSKGETLLELVNPCLELGKITRECKNKMGNAMEKIKTNPADVNKEQICDVAKSLTGCIDGLTTDCKNEVTKNAVSGLYSAITSQCNAA